MNCPCANCTERHIACHDKCSNYTEWRKYIMSRNRWLDIKNHDDRAKAIRITSIYGDSYSKKKLNVLR